MLRFGAADDDPHGFVLSTELHVAEPPEAVFDFFSDASQLEAITPSWLHFAVETGRPIEMSSGTLIDYRLRLHGWPMRWRTLISVWEPPFRFVDEQVRGPYRYWRHEHTFEPCAGGTMVCDVVRYGVPLGRIVHLLFVRHDLRRIFEYRQQQLSQIFTPLPPVQTSDA